VEILSGKLTSRKVYIKTYHYTSFSNWERIQKEGLIPYAIKHDEIKEITGEYPTGTWLWINKPEGISHMGCVILQLSTKSDYIIVRLEVTISDKDTYKYHGQRIKLPHVGTIGAFVYHENEEAVICTECIPPERIKLDGVYDVRERLA
jgi:hypothetical protein